MLAQFQLVFRVRNFCRQGPVTNFINSRMQTCIQRYRAKRKLDEVRANVFTKYLMLGGVDATSTKQFTGGLDKDTLENSTAQEIAAIQASDFIRTGSNSAKFL